METTFPLLPTDDQLIVEVLEEQERRQGQIIIPRTVQEAPQRGLVVAVGPGGLAEHSWRSEETVLVPRRLPMPCKVGDVVWFARYAGKELTVDGREYLALRARDVVAIDTRGLAAVQPAPAEPTAETEEQTVEVAAR